MGCWHRIGHIDHLAARAESPLVGEGRKSWSYVMDRILEKGHRTEVVAVGILGDRNPGEGLVVGNPGHSLEGTGCMDLT